jgi:hypothetical protein
MCESGVSVGGFPQKYKTHIVGRDFLFLQGTNRSVAGAYRNGTNRGFGRFKSPAAQAT